MADTLLTELSQTKALINARLASKKAYHSLFQLHAISDHFQMARSMTYIEHDLATPIRFHNFPLNDDTGG